MHITPWIVILLYSTVLHNHAHHDSLNEALSVYKRGQVQMIYNKRRPRLSPSHRVPIHWLIIALHIFAKTIFLIKL